MLDGELVIRKNGEVGSFNDLQQRLNRKKPDAEADRRRPAIWSSTMRCGSATPISARCRSPRGVSVSTAGMPQTQPRAMDLAMPLPFDGPESLVRLRASASEQAARMSKG